MATIRDVAAEAGLSVGTVSRILNNRGYISPKAREKVENAMRKLKYQPNEIARSLSQSNSSMVGIIIPTLLNPYFPTLLKYLDDELEARDMQPLVFVSDGDDEKEIRFLDKCKKNRVSGIILCSGNFKAVRLVDYGVPVVSIERMGLDGAISVVCDNYNGGRLAADHLIERGCTVPVMIAGDQDEAMPADGRICGFEERIKANGLTAGIYHATREMFHSQDYRSLVERVFNENPDMDGLFCSSDIIAATAIQEASRRGMNVPSSIKIIGFDDTWYSSTIMPSLTTIKQPIKEMAMIAISSLEAAWKAGSFPSSTIKLDVSLVVRESA